MSLDMDVGRVVRLSGGGAGVPSIFLTGAGGVFINLMLLVVVVVSRFNIICDDMPVKLQQILAGRTQFIPSPSQAVTKPWWTLQRSDESYLLE
jgi:hypothetical protein